MPGEKAVEQDTVDVETWNHRGALGRTQVLRWRGTAELVPPCLAMQGSPDAGCPGGVRENRHASDRVRPRKPLRLWRPFCC